MPAKGKGNSTRPSGIFFTISSVSLSIFFFYVLFNMYHLLRNNYATFKEIRTRTITVQGSKGDSKKAKLFITLQRSPDFQENMQKFNAIREENERLAKKNAPAEDAEKKETNK